MTEEDRAAGRAKIEAGELDRLRALLHEMSPDVLDHLGIRLERPNPDRWVWLRDIMADCLENLGRNKAARNLRDFPFGGVHTTYPVGISADLLDQMAGRIVSRLKAEVACDAPIPASTQEGEAK